MKKVPGKVHHVRISNLHSKVQEEDVAKVFHILFGNDCNARVYPFQQSDNGNLQETAISFIIRDDRITFADALVELNNARVAYGPFGQQEYSEMAVQDAKGDGITLVAMSHHRPAFDCYFIHGLHGHPFSTFIQGAKFPTHGQPVFWPADWLPEKAEHHRRLGLFFVFGYNTSFTRGKDFCPAVERIAKSLLEAIMSTRDPGTDRPILLVGHSLGGLVACQAVVLAMDAGESATWYPFLHSSDCEFLVRGVSFFGTPFKGSILASLAAPIVGMAPVPGLSNTQLSQLRQEDQRTKAMLTRFEEIRNKQLNSFPVLLFWEEKKVVRNVLGRRLGHQHYPGIIEPIVKYTSKEHKFFEKNVGDMMWRCLLHSIDSGPSNSIPARRDNQNCELGEQWRGRRLGNGVQKRTENTVYFEVELNDSPRGMYIDNQPGPSLHHLGPSVRESVRTPSAPAKKSVDRSNNALGWQDKTPYFIPPEHHLPGTCNWILEKPLYKQWHDSPKGGTLVITAPVGRGKTVLAGFITNHLLSEPDKDPLSPNLVVPFYCRAGLGSFKPSTILEHFLHHIHKRFPVETDQVISSMSDLHGTRRRFPALWTAFKILRQKLSFSLFAVVDGIDEIIREGWSNKNSERNEILSTFLMDLCRLLPTEGAAAVVKVVFISQPLPSITDVAKSFSNTLLEIDDADVALNVQSLVEARLRPFFKERPLKSDEVDTLIEIIKEQSGAIFIYADRIISQIQKRIETFDAFESYKELIQSFQPGLDEIYGSTLREILDAADCSKQTKQIIILALRVLVAAQKDLTPGQLAHFVGCALVRHLHVRTAMDISKETAEIYQTCIPRVQDLLGELRRRCGNIVRVTPNSINFSHNTVHKYLSRIDSPDLNVFTFKSQDEATNFTAGLCLDFMMVWHRMWQDNLQLREDEPNRQDSFLKTLDFVLENWTKYLREVTDLSTLWTAVCNVLDEKNHQWLRVAGTLLKSEVARDHNLPPALLLSKRNVLNVLARSQLYISGRKVSGIGRPKVPLRQIFRPRLPTLILHIDQQDEQGKNILHYLASDGWLPVMDLILPFANKLSRSGMPMKDNTGKTPFWSAVQSHDEPMVWKMIDVSQTERETESVWEWSTLQEASCFMSPKLVNWLLENGWEINHQVSRFESTPLMTATFYENLPVVKLLLEKGASLPNRDWIKETALHLAARKGNIEIIRLLLDKWDVSREMPLNNEGRTPIYSAAREGHLAAFELLHARCPETPPDADQQRLSHVAARGGHVSILQSPLLERASLSIADKYGRTPLHYACMSKNAEAVRYCLQFNDVNTCALDFGAPFSSCSSQQYSLTPIHLAISSETEEIVNILLESPTLKAENVRTADGNTIVHVSVMTGSITILKSLLESKGLNPMLPNKDGRLPIHWAAMRGNLELFKYLHYACSAHADYHIDIADDNGHTVLFHAIHYSNADIFDFICQEARPDFKIRDKQNRTYLFAAAEQDDPDILQRVFDRCKVDVNDIDSYKMSPLHKAASRGFAAIVKALLLKGASISLEDDMGDTPLFDAMLRSHSDVVKLLIESGSDPLHCINKLGVSILHLIAPLAPEFEPLKPLLEKVTVPTLNKHQWLAYSLQSILSHRAEWIGSERLRHGPIWMIGQTLRNYERIYETPKRPATADDIKILFSLLFTKLVKDQIDMEKQCRICYGYRTATAAHFCRDCPDHDVLCHGCFLDWSKRRPLEGCPPTHEYMEIRYEELSDSENGPVNKEGDSLERFLDKLQEKYCPNPVERPETPPLPKAKYYMKNNQWHYELLEVKAVNGVP